VPNFDLVRVGTQAAGGAVVYACIN
jgi:hypothetical protein